MDWLLVSYSDLGTDGTLQSGTFHYAAGQWRNKELFRKSGSDGCVKVYTAKCGAGGIEVREFCEDKDKEKISVRCLGGFFCITSSRKSDIDEGEVIVLRDPLKGTVTLESGRVSFQRVDAASGSRKFSEERVIWTSMDKSMVAYHCGGKWYIQEAKHYDGERCDGLAFTNHIDWTSSSAVWWEKVTLWGWTEVFPSMRTDLTAADVLAPLGKCKCSSNGECDTDSGLKKMEHDSNRAAYCPKQH
jgi:hypothetical protein